MSLISVFEDISIFDDVVTFFCPPGYRSRFRMKCLCLWNMLCSCFENDVSKLLDSGVRVNVFVDV